MPDNNLDKRRRVLQALGDSACRDLSSRVLARKCRVSHDLVHRMRREKLSTDDNDSGRRCQGDQPVAPVLTGEQLAAAGCPPALGKRIVSRLGAMQADEQRRAQQLLVDLLL